MFYDERHHPEAVMNNVTKYTPANRTFAVIDGGLDAKVSIESPPAVHQPKLLDQLRQAIRMRHYSYRTEKAYTHWVKRYILFHHRRHPVQRARLKSANSFPRLQAIFESVRRRRIKLSMPYCSYTEKCSISRSDSLMVSFVRSGRIVCRWF